MDPMPYEANGAPTHSGNKFRGYPVRFLDIPYVRDFIADIGAFSQTARLRMS
ncbi:hypothetical protein DPMN_116478 [Dreissena polymorpha]|uniref:Uncharacterized protein n=1 Tax=Dreissena polymorpha TaxID=45954 RepID=A0A9D4QUB8_DREPO|nr:hypothetical protein DPMN_116478 [Dreissena polymorpha]